MFFFIENGGAINLENVNAFNISYNKIEGC